MWEVVSGGGALAELSCVEDDSKDGPGMSGSWGNKPRPRARIEEQIAYWYLRQTQGQYPHSDRMCGLALTNRAGRLPGIPVLADWQHPGQMPVMK